MTTYRKLITTAALAAALALTATASDGSSLAQAGDRSASHLTAATSIPFRAILSSANEVPAANINATGAATLWVHVIRDANGQIVSGSVDFNVRYAFPAGETTFTGLHIHRGPAGVNGGVTVNSGISSAAPVIGSGPGEIRRQGQVALTDAQGLLTLIGMMTEPEGYYVNLHTTQFPGGAIRGQLQRADMLVTMVRLSPENEVPPVAGLNARGSGAVTLVAARDNRGVITSTEATFDVNYTGFPAATNITGMHIHPGPAGVNGGVALNSGIASAAPVVVGATGAGNLRYEVDLDMTNATVAAAVNGMFVNPENYYLNVHTSVNTGGAIRGQTRRTDRMIFPLELSGSAEVPAVVRPGASAPSLFTVHALRNDDGSIAAAQAIFDVNYRFPGAMTFTGLHIHNGVEGVNGGVTINTGLSAASPVATTAGNGNIYRAVTVDSEAGLATLNSLVANPENHYMNLHSTENAGGEVRAQVSPARAALPRITAVINSVSDPSINGGARGGLLTIFGSNLSKVFTSLDGMAGGRAPAMLNGTRATIGGLAMPLVVVATDSALSPTDYIVAQVPFEVAAGTHPVVVSNGNGAGNAITARVASQAPTVYFDQDGAIAFRADQSLVRTAAPARGGETISLLCTGLGQTTPPLRTGEAAGSAAAAVDDVTVVFGEGTGVPAQAVAVPGAVGAYFVRVTVPVGLAAGRVNLWVVASGSTSNGVPLPTAR